MQRTQYVRVIRLADGFIGRRQAMLYHRIYGAQIVQQGDSYIAIVDITDEDTAKRLENFCEYIHHIKPLMEKES